MPENGTRSKILFNGPGVLDAICAIARLDTFAKDFENKHVKALADIGESPLSRLLSKLVKLGHLERVGDGEFKRIDGPFWKAMLELESAWAGLPAVNRD